MPFTPPPDKPNFVFGTGRLSTDRYDFEAHLEGTNPPYATNFRHNATQVDLFPTLVIDGYSATTVQQALELLNGIVTAPTISLATTTSPGIIQLGGDLAGINTSGLAPRVSGIQGRAVQNVTPTTGQVLTWNSGGFWAPATSSSNFIASHDLSGNNTSQTVIGIQGVAVLSTSPTTGQVLTFNGTQWSPAASNAFTAGQDLSGSSSSQTVVGIEGIPISIVGLSNGQVLQYNSGQWTNVTPSPGVTFAGDLSGTSSSQTVVGLQGRSVSSSAPTSGQVLGWNGSAWTPTTSSTVVFSGDLSGTSTSQTVVGLQGHPVSSSTPIAGQFLEWNGGAWVSAAAFTASGDLSGTSSSQTVIGLQGHSISSTAPSSGQVLEWNGSAWTPTTFSAGGTRVYFGSGTDGSATFDGTSTVVLNGTSFVPSASVYTLTRDIACVNITINSGVTIALGGWGIFCTGTLTNNGIVDHSGSNGSSGGSGGSGAVNGLFYGGGSNGGNSNPATAGGSFSSGLIGFGGTGGSAGAAGGSLNNAGAPPLYTLPGTVLISGGLIGNNGTAVQEANLWGGTGGGGGVVGGSSGALTGGGGGGGGGYMSITCSILSGSGTFRAIGGNGGNGSPNAFPSGGGGGGGGGAISIVYGTLSSWTGTLNVAGGTGGTGGATGGANGNPGGNGQTVMIQG